MGPQLIHKLQSHAHACLIQKYYLPFILVCLLTYKKHAYRCQFFWIGIFPKFPYIQKCKNSGNTEIVEIQSTDI